MSFKPHRPIETCDFKEKCRIPKAYHIKHLAGMNSVWVSAGPMWGSAGVCASHACPAHTGIGLCTTRALNTYLWSSQFGDNRWCLLSWDLMIQSLRFKSCVSTWEERDAGCSWWRAGNLPFRSFSFLNLKENTLSDSTQKLVDQMGCPMSFPVKKK